MLVVGCALFRDASHHFIFFITHSPADDSESCLLNPNDLLVTSCKEHSFRIGGGNAQFLAHVRRGWYVSSISHEVPMHLVVSFAHAERVRTARLHGDFAVITALGIRCPRDRSCLHFALDISLTDYITRFTAAYLSFVLRSFDTTLSLPIPIFLSRPSTILAEIHLLYASYF